MAKRKSLQELTIKDNFMFGAVMLEPENCKGVIERVLGISIDHVEVDVEKSIVYHPKYKGIRLDAYAKDADNTRYSIEMQVKSQKDIRKRARYYHSQIDMDLLLTGMKYKKILLYTKQSMQRKSRDFDGRWSTYYFSQYERH